VLAVAPNTAILVPTSNKQPYLESLWECFTLVEYIFNLLDCFRFVLQQDGCWHTCKPQLDWSCNFDPLRSVKDLGPCGKLKTFIFYLVNKSHDKLQIMNLTKTATKTRKEYIINVSSNKSVLLINKKYFTRDRPNGFLEPISIPIYRPFIDR